ASLLAESVAEMDALEPATFGLGRNDVLRPEHPARAEITVLLGMLGVPAPEVWQGGNDPNRIDVMPYYKGRANLVLGAAVSSPLTPAQRFAVGRLALGLRLGVAPLVRRGPERAATALFAAAAAAEVSFGAGEGRAGMAET